jgi:hypothetical protein
VDNLGYVLAGYLLTAGALSLYVARLMARVRRAGRTIDAAGERSGTSTLA